MRRDVWSLTDIEWVPPSEIPELVYEADVVAIDLETYDPEIKTKGPGWATNNGKVYEFWSLKIPQQIKLC